VSRLPRPRYCGFALAGLLVIGLAGRPSAVPDPSGLSQQEDVAAPAERSAESNWVTALPARPVAGGAADAARIYVPLEGGLLVALDRETGRLLWTHPHESAWTPVVTPGALWIATGATMRALDPATGRLEHTVPLPFPAAGPPSRAGDLAIVSLESGDLWALRASGAIAWRRLLAAPSRVAAGAGPGGVLAVALSDGSLVAIAADTGEVRWTRQVAEGLTAPVAASNRVFVGSSGNAFYAFGAGSGRLTWVWKTGGDVIGAVAAGDTVYVTALDNVIRAFDVDSGRLRWKQLSSTRPVSPPIHSGTRLLVAGARPALTIYDAATGAVVGPVPFPAELERAVFAGTPLVLPEPDAPGARIVAVTRDGRAVGVHPDVR
jgi:outer membrane protein assembly factor BamB